MNVKDHLADSQVASVWRSSHCGLLQHTRANIFFAAMRLNAQQHVLKYLCRTLNRGKVWRQRQSFQHLAQIIKQTNKNAETFHVAEWDCALRIVCCVGCVRQDSLLRYLVRLWRCAVAGKVTGAVSWVFLMPLFIRQAKPSAAAFFKQYCGTPKSLLITLRKAGCEMLSA